MVDQRATGPARKGLPVLRIRAAGRELAIDAERVREVLPMVASTAPAEGPAWLLGFLDHRGTLRPLVDGGALLGADRVPALRRSRIVLVDLAGSAGEAHGDAHGDAEARIAGMVVEEVLGVAHFDEASAHPGLAVDGLDHLGPLATCDGVLVQLLRLERAFGPQERKILFGRLPEAQPDREAPA